MDIIPHGQAHVPGSSKSRGDSPLLYKTPISWLSRFHRPDETAYGDLSPAVLVFLPVTVTSADPLEAESLSSSLAELDAHIFYGESEKSQQAEDLLACVTIQFNLVRPSC